MALNEQIVEETRYYRQCVDKDNKKWERYGLWNRGKDTECEDGNTVETKVGAIKGITTSTNVSETGYAADAKTVSEINQSLTELSSAEGIANSEQSNIATFDTSSWDDGAYLIFNYYVGAGSFFELLIKRGSNIAITNLTRKSTVNGTVVTMEVGNFWCLLLRKCIYR